MNRVLNRIVGRQAEDRAAPGQNLGGAAEEIPHGVPVSRLDRINIKGQRLVVQGNPRVVVRIEHLGRPPEDLAVEEGSALWTDSHDADVLGHGGKGNTLALQIRPRKRAMARALSLDSRPMAESDPFDVLELRARFDLEPAEIQRAYFAHSAGLHPDIASGDPEAQRRMAALNQAKRILDDPEKRASALLKRLGGPGGEDRSLPPGFLMDIMEVREAIEEALATPDGRTEARQRWEAWAEKQRRTAIREVGDLFSALGTPPAAADLGRIRVRLNAWRYIERLIEQLDPDYDAGRADLES
jgi:hypothetical protein